MTKRSNPRLNCPHCGEFARVRTSQQLTPVYRESLLECQNPECNWRGKLSQEVTHTLSPSARPNPEVRLPDAPRAHRAI